jgi:hypothetical protein
LINYQCGQDRYERAPDAYDLVFILKMQE